jgi:predicted acylesterase/phospholipase RssA
MEITNEGRGWHLHFHLVVDGGYVNQYVLSEAWRQAARDGSRIVFIRSASRRTIKDSLPAYVTKYAGKGFRPQDWTAAQLCEFASAVQGIRTFGVFGSLYKARSEWRDWLKTIREAR